MDSTHKALAFVAGVTTICYIVLLAVIGGETASAVGVGYVTFLSMICIAWEITKENHIE